MCLLMQVVISKSDDFLVIFAGGTSQRTSFTESINAALLCVSCVGALWELCRDSVVALWVLCGGLRGCSVGSFSSRKAALMDSVNDVRWPFPR